MNFKDTKIYAIGKFLKDRPNEIFSRSDLYNNLKINKSTISSSIRKLATGRNVIKKGRLQYRKNGRLRKQSYPDMPMKNFQSDGKGHYRYFKKVSFKTWKVDFKLIETSATDPQNRWITEKMTKGTDRKSMDLSAWATGIVPANISKGKVVSVAAVKLFKTSIINLAAEGIFLFEAVEEENVILGGEIENENPLDKSYNEDWAGKINFVNNVGSALEWKVDFKIKEYEYND